MAEDIYKIIQEKMHAYPLGAPADPRFFEILKLYFTPEEAAVIARMEMRPMQAAEIAALAGQPETGIVQMMESLADRGLIFSRKKKDQVFYSLMPPLPGIFEFPVMKGKEIPHFEELSRLWNEYFEKSLGPYMHDERGPATLRILPIEQEIQSNLEVLPFELASDIVNKAHMLALAKCPCRLITRKCDSPIDVCILLNAYADYLTDRKIARKLSVDEAHGILIRTEEAGLVHTTNNSKESMPFVCSCCSCCCFMLRGAVQLNLPRSVATSRYLAKVDGDNCEGCGLCEERCHFSAITVSDTSGITGEKCYGCGLCVSECPNHAISLILRPDYIHPPENGSDLLRQLAEARGTIVK